MRSFTFFAAATGLFFATDAPAAGEQCPFDLATLSFGGSDIEQARCLLSPVEYMGEIGERPKRLGAFLESHVGRPVAIDRERLRALLEQEGLTPLAETVARPLSRARDNDPAAPAARYFVIHDTSQELEDATRFPSDDDPSVNGLGATYDDGTWIAHTFTNRRGEVLLAYDYSIAWRAVRLERDEHSGGLLKGLFLHNELNQPRLAFPGATRYRFRVAPSPGVTAPQYDRLALLYILASVRAGRWMIPAFHAVIDKGISGGHDDPQNFDLAAWEAALERRDRQLAGPD